MPIDHREITFELAIEDHPLANGCEKGDRDNFRRGICSDPTVLMPFLEETLPDEWEYLKGILKEKAEEVLLGNLE